MKDTEIMGLLTTNIIVRPDKKLLELIISTMVGENCELSKHRMAEIDHIFAIVGEIFEI